jgi:oligosaccharide repeat unit polymerase
MGDFYSTSAYLLLYQILCLAILFGTYFLIRKKREAKLTQIAVSVSKENALLYFSVFLFLFAAIRVVMLTGGNFLFLLTRRSGNSDAGDIVKENYLVALSSATVLIAIPILAGIKAFAGKPWKKLLFLYIPNIILVYIITGNRGVALYSVLIFVIIVSLKRKFSIIKISFVGFALIIAFSILGLVRRSSSSTDNIVQSIKEQSDVEDQWYYELTSYQLQLRDEAVYNATPVTGTLTGESYLNIVFFPLPSSAAGDLKPKLLDLIVANVFYNRSDVGLPLNAMGESYLNFGIFGSLVFILLGAIMAGITNFLSASGSIKFYCMSLVLCFYAQTWSSTYIVYVLQYTLLLYIPIKLIKVGKAKYAK